MAVLTAAKRLRHAAKMTAFRTASKVIMSSSPWVLGRRMLGVVYAPDEKSAEAAIAEFKIGEDMRRRLIVRPDDD